MSDDLVKRLRNLVKRLRNPTNLDWEMQDIGTEAANRIEQLEAALRKIALDEPDCCMIADRMKETAEIALGKKND